VSRFASLAELTQRKTGIERSDMQKNYSELTLRISANLKKLRKDIPDTMQGFSALAQAACRDGALDKKTKELIALALGVAAHCDGCIGFHTEALVRLGATRQEVQEALGLAVYMGGGPSLMYAADAIAAYEEFRAQLGVAA
jgi:AhpD family alkylhydroperoxidase